MFETQVIISQLSGPQVMLLICIFISFILFTLNKKKDSLVIVLSTAIAMGVTYSLKYILKVPRPDDMLVLGDVYRFPSGHATMASVIMTLVIYYTSLKVKGLSLRYALYTLAVLWFILVIYSRLYLHAHLPVDVIVGGLIGVSITCVVIKIFKRTRLL